MTASADRSTTFHAFAEDLPGELWRAHVRRHWPRLRPSIEDGASEAGWRMAVLGLSIPQLAAMAADLSVATGAHDHAMIGFLSHVDPPPPAVAGRQVTGGGALVRNIDAEGARHEWTLWRSKLGSRHVMGTTSGLWGLLDGINGDGLVVSLNSGRDAHTEPAVCGFSGTLLVRHLLEHCAAVRDVDEALIGWRSATTQDITVLDAAGSRAAYRLRPGEPTLRGHTQHWNTSGEALTAMLSAPRYRTETASGGRTLHTTVYLPAEGSVTLLWPNEIRTWHIDTFEPEEIEVRYRANLTP